MAHWWQTGIVYQIYPRSIQDSNDDGIGDLPGIIERLDYLQWLGVDAIWVSPFYPSPMKDFGYDVADYTDADPIFGTLSDAEQLIAEAHARNIKIIFDLVVNHTSDQHPWFLESRSSRDNPKRDWYMWADPKPDGSPPNNWLGHFDGESAWEWDEATEQYYYHTFLAEQPELNWRNPEMRAAMLDNMRFWFDRGVDGFRLDVSYRAMKDAELRDNPPNPAWEPGMDPFRRLLEPHTRNIPEIHTFNKWLREVADEYEERVLIGEISLPFEELVKHYGENNDELDLPFNFDLIHREWTAEEIRSSIADYEAALPEGAWPNYVLGNHDQHRFGSRTAPEQIRIGMMLLLTLRGTPTVYYGEEIGMLDGDIPLNRVQDPWEKNVPGLGLGRDPERTPMQWDASPQAGFTSEGVEAWLPIASGYTTINVNNERSEPASILMMTRSLIRLRRDHAALHLGGQTLLDAPEGVLAYERQVEGERFVVALNFRGEYTAFAAGDEGNIVFSTYMDLPPADSPLRPHEGLLLRI
ncbi:MAG: alpha-amylase family glycosyl hydrolase [Anaerolineae bacterium]